MGNTFVVTTCLAFRSIVSVHQLNTYIQGFLPLDKVACLMLQMLTNCGFLVDNMSVVNISQQERKIFQEGV